MELDEFIELVKEQQGIDLSGVLTTADKIGRPEKALERQAIIDFENRNPMAGGGMLVQPSADGSRPGYAKDKTKTLKKMDIAGRSATGETIDLKKVQELVTKANQGNKYITAEDIAAQYYKNKKIGKEYIREYEGKKAKKFPRLWGSPAVNEILKTLNPKELKVQKVLEDMLADENPFTTGKLKNTNKKLSDLQFSKMAPWKQYISNETGLAYKGIESSLNSKNFMDGWYKNNRATLISFGQIKKDLEGLSFSQQLNYATDVRGNKPVYTRIEKTRSSVFDVMDYALRSWNNTKGKGPIQFFDKNGKPIKWQTNKKIPYSQVSFKYDGNTYSVGGSNNTISLRKSGNTFFPEVYEQNSFKNKLYDTLVDNPFKPGKEIQFGKLMNLIQNKGYGWKKGTGVLDILHGPNGVALEPFTNLSFGTRDLNLTLSQIDKIPIKGLKNKYINILTKDFKGKSGEELIQAIINQQTNLASKITAGEKFIIPTRTQLFLDTLDPDKKIIGDVGKNTEKYIKQKIYEQTRASSKLKPNVVSEIKNKPLYKKLMKFCPKSNGGEAGVCTIDEAMKGMISESKQLQSGNMNDAQAKKTAQKIRAVTRVGTGSTLMGLLGPYGVAGEVVIDGAFMANNMLDGGDTYKEALSKSLIKYAMPKDARERLEKETDLNTMILGSDTSGLAANYADALKKDEDLKQKYENYLKVNQDDVSSLDDPYSSGSAPMFSLADKNKAERELIQAMTRAEPTYGKSIYEIAKFGSPEQQAFATKQEVFDAEKMQRRMDYDRKILGPIKDLFDTGFYSPAQLKQLELKADRDTKAIGESQYGMPPSQSSALQRFGDVAQLGVANLAGGGIAGLSGGDPEGAMLESMNPDSQGLQGLFNRVKKV